MVLLALCDPIEDVVINLYTTESHQTIQLTRLSILTKLVEDYLPYQTVYDILANLGKNQRGKGTPCDYQFKFSRNF